MFAFHCESIRQMHMSLLVSLSVKVGDVTLASIVLCMPMNLLSIVSNTL